jgi:hypothetical protein
MKWIQSDRAIKAPDGELLGFALTEISAQALVDSHNTVIDSMVLENARLKQRVDSWLAEETVRQERETRLMARVEELEGALAQYYNDAVGKRVSVESMQSIVLLNRLAQSCAAKREG